MELEQSQDSQMRMTIHKFVNHSAHLWLLFNIRPIIAVVWCGKGCIMSQTVTRSTGITNHNTKVLARQVQNGSHSWRRLESNWNAIRDPFFSPIPVVTGLFDGRKKRGLWRICKINNANFCFGESGVFLQQLQHFTWWRQHTLYG